MFSNDYGAAHGQDSGMGKDERTSISGALEPIRTTTTGDGLEAERLRQRIAELERELALLRLGGAPRPTAVRSIAPHPHGNIQKVVPWELDLATWCFTYVGNRAEALLGYPVSDWYAEGFWIARLHPEDRDQAIRFCTEASRHGEDHEMVYRMQARDGRDVWVHDVVSVVPDAEGAPATLRGVLIDITAEQQREQVVRASRERLRLFEITIEQAGECIYITDAQSRICYVNPAFERVTGYTAEEVMGRNPRLLKSGEQSPEVYRQLKQMLAAGKVWTGRFVNRRSDGSRFVVEGSISPIRDTEGQVTHYVAVQHDITSEIELRRQLDHAQRLESVGHLAGGIAHDFNNMLTPIFGYAELLLLERGQESEVRAALDPLLEAASRARDLTCQLLAFSRRQVLQVQRVDLAALVKGFEKILRRTLREDIDLHLHLVPGTGSIEVDVGHIEQVLLNLAVNAQDAMPLGGQLHIETEERILDAGPSPGPPGIPEGPWVILRVRDTGSGIADEHLDRIFDPFFTTKEAGRGTGLGLSTVHGIIVQHGGQVKVTRPTGGGTSFEVFLPRCDEPPRVLRPKPDGAWDVDRGDETILLVEDDDGVRRIVEKVLTRYGYRVLSEGDPLRALARATEIGPELDLLLTDVVLPHLNGRQLYQKLAPRHPGLRVLYLTGYDDEVITRHGVLEPGVHLVAKPIEIRALVHEIRKVLAGPPPDLALPTTPDQP